jgi:hypothetical protein
LRVISKGEERICGLLVCGTNKTGRHRRLGSRGDPDAFVV